MDRNAKLLMRMAQIGAISSVYHFKNTDQDKLNSYFSKLVPNQLIQLQLCEALVREEDLPRLKKMNTNVYVYGEGFQVDPT